MSTRSTVPSASVSLYEAELTVGAVRSKAKFELDEGEQALLLARVNEMINSTKFIPVKSTGSELLFRII